MANSTPIKIYGRTYNIRSDKFSVPPEEVAAYVDGKMSELSSARGSTSTMDLAVLTAINIAYELLVARQENRRLLEQADERLEALIAKGQNALDNAG